jgi:hypothetical protein
MPVDLGTGVGVVDGCHTETVVAFGFDCPQLLKYKVYLLADEHIESHPIIL